MTAKKLTPKQEMFVSEYLKDLNGTQAAIRAGYSEKTAQAIATENLSKPLISEAIAEAQAKRLERVNADADYVLKRLIEIDQMDVADILDDDGSVKPIRDWPKVWRTYLSGIDLSEIWEGRGDERDMVGILKKIKWPDKVKNLELLGKHASVNAFKEHVEHSGEVRNTWTMAPVTTNKG